MDEIKIVIVGYGFVGKAIEFGFDTKRVKITKVDPKYFDTSISDLKDEYDAVFVAVPTPMGSFKILEDTVNHISLAVNTKAIIIKSTVTPDVLQKKVFENHRVVYNPEFLTERNALEDFINPPMHVFGGNRDTTEFVEKLYKGWSRCVECPVYHMTRVEASLVKYGINSFLATKVAWFNQFYELINSSKKLPNGVADYNTVVRAITADKRIGASHTVVPGFDGKFGFGGACFPKDTDALIRFADGPKTGFMSILDTAIRYNNEVRSLYSLDERELEQNVNFG